jgi:diadenosine tetraphosphate (Ap4A) HIT family hydrolase
MSGWWVSGDCGDRRGQYGQGVVESISDEQGCLLCDPAAADAQFQRVRVWEDELWRLSIVLQGPLPGFAHLEPKRHIPFITELNGPEAVTLGSVLGRVTRALREAASAEMTYVYVFGDHVPHLHFNLAPHRTGDALRGGPGLLDPEVLDAAVETHRAVATGVRALLTDR